MTDRVSAVIAACPWPAAAVSIAAIAGLVAILWAVVWVVLRA